MYGNNQAASITRPGNNRKMFKEQSRMGSYGKDGQLWKRWTVMEKTCSCGRDEQLGKDGQLSAVYGGGSQATPVLLAQSSDGDKRYRNCPSFS